MATERKNTLRNRRRTPNRDRPRVGGAGHGGKLWFPKFNLTEYEIKLLKLGLY